MLRTGLSFEIIVVDNASSDGTADMLASEFPHVRLPHMPENTGAAGGFAAGLAKGVGRDNDWIWMFDDDDHATPGALAAMLDTISQLPPHTRDCRLRTP